MNKPVVGRVVSPNDPCPHGTTLGTCREAWCRGRIEDLDQPEYQTGAFVAPALQEPEKGSRHGKED